MQGQQQLYNNSSISNKYAGLKVIGFRADDTACGILRVQYPLDYLSKMGAQTKIVTQVNLQELLWADFIIAQRQYNQGVIEMLNSVKEMGKTIIYEIDDDLHAVHNSSPAFSTYKRGTEELKNATNLITQCHGLTVSTPELAAEYLQYNRNTYVLPNCIDFDIRDWTTRVDRADDSLVIGWAGGTTHQEDLPILGKIVAAVMAKYPKVKFAICTNPAIAQNEVPKWWPESQMPEDRIIFMTDVHINEYPKVLSNFDIGLAPIRNTTFNRCKSPLKLMEYGAWGIPYVASKVAPYQRYVDQGVDGWTVENEDINGWVQKIGALIEDETLRKTMGDAAQTKVRELYDYKVNIDNWVNAWESIRFAGWQGDIGPGPKVITDIGRNDTCPCGSGIKYKKCCSSAWG